MATRLLSMILASICMSGCAAVDGTKSWKLTADTLPGFIRQLCASPGASVYFTDLPRTLCVTEAEQNQIIDALRKDTHHITVDEQVLRGSSFPVPYLIYLFRGPSALMIGVDYFGFGIGERDECRFANASLARTLEHIFKRNGVLEGDSAGYCKEMLARGAAGPLLPEFGAPRVVPGPVTVDKAVVGSDAAVNVISRFVEGAADDEIAVRILGPDSTKVGPGITKAGENAMLKALVEDTYPNTHNVALIRSPGRGKGLEITVYSGTAACVIWLDESGFYFGKDGQYRFKNASLARNIQNVLAETGVLDSPEGAMYKHICEAAGD